jgi:hypothetical protein
VADGEATEAIPRRSVHSAARTAGGASYGAEGIVNRNWSDIADAAFVAFVVTCLGLIVFFTGSVIIEFVKMFWK